MSPHRDADVGDRGGTRVQGQAPKLSLPVVFRRRAAWSGVGHDDTETFAGVPHDGPGEGSSRCATYRDRL